MKKLLLITGDLATGKSTFANILAKRYDTSAFCKDTIKEVLHKRYLKRMNNENRHPVHLSTTLDVFEHFKGYTEYSRTELIPGNVIEICADDFSYQEDEQLLKTIDGFMKR